MNDESKITISHTDLCRAIAFWMSANVTRYGVEVSEVKGTRDGYGPNEFAVTFKRAEQPAKEIDPEVRRMGEDYVDGLMGKGQQ